VTDVASRRWLHGALSVLVVLVVLAPVFEWASAAVGYAEPLENAAAATGAADAATASASLLAGYAVPGLPGGAGTFAAALLGTALTLAVGVGVGRLLER
jgi:cobalt/nickel transport protein